MYVHCICKSCACTAHIYGCNIAVLMPVQVLQKKFEEFKRDISVSTERYTAVNGLARRLVAEGHSDTVLIKEKQDAMRWATIGRDVSMGNT